MIIPMNLLSCLPQELSQDVLLSWLNLVDVACIDSAMCSTQHRLRFLNLAYSALCVYTYADYFRSCKRVNVHRYMKLEFLKWVVLRGVRLSTLEVTAHDEDMHLDILKHSGAHIKFVLVDNQKRSVYAAIADYCPNVERIVFGEYLEQDDVVRVCASCRNLKHITFTMTTPMMLETVAIGGERLFSLDLPFYAGCRIENWTSLLKALPNLQRLDMCTVETEDHMVGAIAQYCPLLRSIALTGSNDLSGAAIFALADGCTRLQQMTLNITLSEAAYLHVLRRCRNLTSIRLNDSTGVTPEVIRMLGRDFPALQELGLRYWQGDLNVLAEEAQRWPDLRRLELDEVSELTDATLVAFSSHCTQLHAVNLWGCFDITDAAITALAQRCPYLQELQLSRCYNLTDTSLRAIDAHCKRLEWMDVSGCSGMSTDLRRVLYRKYMRR